MKSRLLLTQIHIAELNDEQYSPVSQRYLQALGKNKIMRNSTPTYFMWSLPKGPPPMISSVFPSIINRLEISKLLRNDSLTIFALETLISFISTF